MLPYCSVWSNFFSAVKYTDWKNPKLLSDIYPQSQYSDLFKCNTEFLYLFPHCLHEHFVTLYYRSAWGWGFCGWRKIKFGFCTKTAHTFTGLQTSDFFSGTMQFRVEYSSRWELVSLFFIFFHLVALFVVSHSCCHACRMTFLQAQHYSWTIAHLSLCNLHLN